MVGVTEEIVLAYQTFYQPSKDIMIGIEGFSKVIQVERCTMGTSIPTLINTTFG